MFRKRTKCKLQKLETKLMKFYDEIVSYENGRFINMPAGDKKGYAELRQKFPLYEKTVVEYNSLIYKMTKKNHLYGYIPLPHFIVFPTYAPTTIGWRMGLGEGYAILWNQIIKKLSNEELQNYCNRFTYPEWWIDKDFPLKYQFLPWKNMVIAEPGLFENTYIQGDYYEYLEYMNWKTHKLDSEQKSNLYAQE